MSNELKPCPFCERADFGVFSAKVSGSMATIYLAGGSGRFPKEEQFKFCPECGRSLQRVRVEPEPKVLTLEELRKMDREPVYCTWIDTEKGEWRILNVDNEMGVSAEGWNDALWDSNYGKTWLAYDRKPE